MSEKRLWIGGYGPEDSAHGRGLAAFREGVESETGGSVLVDVTWDIMDLGRPNTDLFDLVESGEMFFCYFSTSYLDDRVPELNVIETPYLFRDLAQAHAALDGSLGESLRSAVRSRTGFEVLGFWDNGFRHLTNRRHPVHTPYDLAGMSVRMQPNKIHEALIRSWGADPVPVELKAGIDLITNLEVDAQENPLANTVAYGVDKVHKHMTMTGHLYGARGLFAHRETYDSLAPDLREAVDRSVNRAVAVQRSSAEGLEESLRARLEAEGTQFVDPSQLEMEEFVARSQPAVDLAHRDLPGNLFDLVAR